MTTEINNTLEDIKLHLESLNDEDLVQVHNEFCRSANYCDDEIHNNDEEFFEIFLPKSTDAIRACQYGDHRYTDEFVQFNGYANLESFNDPTDRVDINAIAEDIKENERNYFSIGLSELFTCDNCDETMTEEDHNFYGSCNDCREE